MHLSSPTESRFQTAQELDGNYYIAELRDQQYQYPMAELTAWTSIELPTVPEDAALAELHGSSPQFELGEGMPVAEMASVATPDTSMQVLDVEASTPGSILSPVSPANPMPEWFEYRESDLISPVSPVSDEQGLPAKLPGMSPVVFSPEGYSRLPVDEEPIYAEIQGVSEPSLPILRATSVPSSSVHDLLHEAVHDLSSYTPTPSLSTPDSLVGDLLEVFRVQLAESIQKMREPPMSESASSLVNAIAGCSAETYLESGLLAFRKLVQGSLDVEPWDVLGFSFLVVAITTILDRDDLLDSVYVDMLWQCHATTAGSHKFMVMRLLEELWSPSNSSSLLREQSQRFCRVTQPGNHSVSLDSGTVGVNALPGGYRSGVSMHLCLQYFNSIKNSSLYSNNFDPWHLRHPQHPNQRSPSMAEFAWVITNHVMGPLREYIGLEGFLPVVDTIQASVNIQQLVDLDDIQIALIKLGRARARSKRLFDTFVQLVACLCDRVSAWLGNPSITRDQYNLFIVDQTITSFRALQQKRYTLTANETQWQRAAAYTTDQSLHAAGTSNMSANAEYAYAMPSALTPAIPPYPSNLSIEGLSLDSTSN
ncbi:MAG: hypothetical protein Q9187_005143, partial [Circinaria calcarea]